MLFSGIVQQKLEGHLHYVQGVAWDPLGQYIASMSSDRTCKIYANKPQGKSKNAEKVNFVCQHTLVKVEYPNNDESKVCLLFVSAFDCELSLNKSNIILLPCSRQ